IGIIDWRRRELERLGVELRLNRYAEAADVTAEEPELVIIATGGLPDLAWLPGVELCTSAWDVLGGTVPLASDVLVYDGTGRHPAPQVAEMASAQGRRAQFLTIDAQLAQELTYAERAIWKKRTYTIGVPVTCDHALERVERRGNRLVATFRNLLTEQTT